jgi:mannonate dehydratase
VVTALHHVPIGQVWPLEEVAKRKALIEAAGLTWSVVESIPVHESIKTGKPADDCRRYTDNYKQSLRNAAVGGGVDIFCYNFMPVVDWSRTDLDATWDADGSKTLAFDPVAFAAFDIHLLQREGAEKDYTKEQVEAARTFHASLTDSARSSLVANIVQGLPGRTSEAYTLEGLRAALAEYRNVDETAARANLAAFVRELAPLAEDLGVFLALHPDDPPWSLLGLPRVVSTAKDVRDLLGMKSLKDPFDGIKLLRPPSSRVPVTPSRTDHVRGLVRVPRGQRRPGHGRRVRRQDQLRAPEERGQDGSRRLRGERAPGGGRGHVLRGEETAGGEEEEDDGPGRGRW